MLSYNCKHKVKDFQYWCSQIEVVVLPEHDRSPMESSYGFIHPTSSCLAFVLTPRLQKQKETSLDFRGYCVAGTNSSPIVPYAGSLALALTSLSLSRFPCHCLFKTPSCEHFSGTALRNTRRGVVLGWKREDGPLICQDPQAHCVSIHHHGKPEG